MKCTVHVRSFMVIYLLVVLYDRIQYLQRFYIKTKLETPECLCEALVYLPNNSYFQSISSYTTLR